MHFELSFAEIIAAIVMMIGGFWVLIQIIARQFKSAMDERFNTVNSKLTVLEANMAKVHGLETEMLRKHAEYVREFCTKDEMRREMQDQQKALDQIFALLREIHDKVGTKVSRDECHSCKGGQ